MNRRPARSLGGVEIAMIDEDREDQLRARQDGRLYPLGRVLRSTYDADNHETLDADVTGLMIDLSKVPFERDPPRAARPATIAAVNASPPTDIQPPPRSWLGRFGGLWGRVAG